MNLYANTIRKRRWVLALSLALGLPLAVHAMDPEVAAPPEAVTAEDAPGWLGTLAKQPWAKRLMRMWSGEEQDTTGAGSGPYMESILDTVDQGNLFQVFRRGGPIMWPLLCAAFLALATVSERAGFFMLERFRRKAGVQKKFMKVLREGEIEQAIQISRHSRHIVVRVLGYALEHRGSALEGAVKYAKERELHRYRRGIPILDTVITLAPLLGLLGTVTGMMASFSLIGGDLGAPGAITGGIAEALIATAFGLGIAITSLIPFNLMNQKLETATQEIDEAASAMMTLLATRCGAHQKSGGVAC
ncbi:MAG: MotA/TolQ/ExbB proton channel family protein [bacterium]